MISCLRGIIRFCNFKMLSVSNVSLLPDDLRGMKQLNREKFLRNIRVPVLKLSSKNISKVLPFCKPYILKLENFKPLQTLIEDNFDKCIYLNPEKVKCWKDISEEVRMALIDYDISEVNLDTKELQLTYDNFKFVDIFKVILPDNLEKISGYSQIGHIIHVNLRSHLLEYKTLIGAVLLDKIKTSRTVVYKSAIINNTYRNFKMEVIAGDEDFLVTVKEQHCTFQFDFSKVYWNPRLGKEHERVLNALKPNDILFDVFCGVGPFAVPAAKRSIRVFANDLNPDSYKSLNHNAKYNNIQPSLFKSYNLDGKDFICNIFKNFIEDCCNGKEEIYPGSKIYVTMNLPGMAVEFLKYFSGLINDMELLHKFNLDIIVYVYCFTTVDDPVEKSKHMVIDHIGRDINSDILDVFHVRNVSCTKEMMKVTFKLTKEVLFGVGSESEFSEPPSKKICV